MQEPPKATIPVLTEVIDDDETTLGAEPVISDESRPQGADEVIAELQTRLASETFALADELMRNAFAEMEAHLFEQISGRLREALPELIDSVLREHLGGGSDDTGDDDNAHGE